MAKVMFLGGRLDSVAYTGSPTEITTGGTYDSTYADCSIQCASSSVLTATFLDASLAAVNVVSGETVYIHAEFTPSTNASGAALVWWMADSSGNPWLAFRTVSSGTWGFYYNSNTGASPTWTLIGSTFGMTNSIKTLDMKLTIGSPHSAEFSVNGVSQASGTFTNANLTTIRSMKMSAMSDFNSRWSQFMAAEGISTIGGKVKTSRATAAGTNTAWTGAYTDVNEAVGSDATLLSTTAANNKQTHAMGDVTVPSGYAIKSIFHWLRAKNDGAAPNNIKSVIRSGGTDYVAANNLSGIGTSFAALVERYDTDPNTAAEWTGTNWNSAEAGFRSET